MSASRQLFVNLAVDDLDRSVAFFTALGFTFDPRFTDETATMMIVGRACTEALAARRRETRRMKSRPVLFMDWAANVRATVRDCERNFGVRWTHFEWRPVDP